MTTRLRGKGKVGVPDLHSSNNAKLLKALELTCLQISQSINHINGQIKGKVTLIDTMEQQVLVSLHTTNLQVH